MTVEVDTTALIDVCDEVSVIRDLVVCLSLACSSPMLPRDERTALSQLVMLVRARLEALSSVLGRMTPAR